MVTDKSLLRTLFYTTESKMFYLQRHGYLLEKTVSHSADKINGKIGAIVFLYVSLQETAEISHEKFGNLTRGDDATEKERNLQGNGWA